MSRKRPNQKSKKLFPSSLKGTTTRCITLPASPKRAEQPNSISHVADPPILEFTPMAWAKMLFLRKASLPNEVGAFGIASDENNPFLIQDIMIVEQDVSVASVQFTEDGLRAFYHSMDDRGLSPFQFNRVWLHTHPGMLPTPSCTDEGTFEDIFGPCSWAVMFILADNGQYYCRLRVTAGDVSLSGEIKSSVVFSHDFPSSDIPAWQKEFDDKVLSSPTFGQNQYTAWLNGRKIPNDSWWDGSTPVGHANRGELGGDPSSLPQHYKEAGLSKDQVWDEARMEFHDAFDEYANSESYREDTLPVDLDDIDDPRLQDTQEYNDCSDIILASDCPSYPSCQVPIRVVGDNGDGKEKE